MDCWKILEISHTQDLKAIKRAYAKKLKIVRPDENPEVFQNLHVAYKQAQHLAKQALAEHAQQAVDAQQESEDNHQTDDANEDEGASSTESGQHHLTPEELETQEYVQKQFNELVEKCNSVLAEPEKRNRTEEWQFLTESVLMLDHQINSHLGIHVFNEIFKVNNEFKQLSKHKRKYSSPNATVKKATLVYLNHVFNWSLETNNLRYYVGDEACQMLLPVIWEGQDQETTEDPQQVVKGGEIIQGKARQSALEKLGLAQHAIDKINDLFNFVLFVLSIVFVVAAKVSYDEQDYIHTAVFAAILSYLFLQWYGMKKRHKVAYYLMWPFSVLLLLSFPLGTIIGGIFLVNLNRARPYFKS